MNGPPTVFVTRRICVRARATHYARSAAPSSVALAPESLSKLSRLRVCPITALVPRKNARFSTFQLKRTSLPVSAEA